MQTDITKTYIVHVTRMSGDADLIELEPESGVVMKPTFDKDVHNYEIDVDTAVTKVTFDKITASNNATNQAYDIYKQRFQSRLSTIQAEIALYLIT